MSGPDPEDALLALRARFDAVDDQLVALIAERLRLADDAAPLKAALGRPIVDVTREQEAAVRRRAVAHAHDATIDGVVDDVFTVLVLASRARQARQARQARSRR